MIIWQDISISITNTLTLPNTINCPKFIFEGFDTKKKLIVFFSLWGCHISIANHMLMTHKNYTNFQLQLPSS